MDSSGNLFEQNETVANPWQYASCYLDSTTGLYHFGARYYDPTLGRWTQEDPAVPNLASPDSLNRYLYVDDSPINGTDRSGKDFVGNLLNCVGWALIDIIGFLAASFILVNLLGALVAAITALNPLIGMFAAFAVTLAFAILEGGLGYVTYNDIARACGLPQLNM